MFSSKSIESFIIVVLLSFRGFRLNNKETLNLGVDKMYSIVGPALARSYKIGVVDNNWLVGWLVGNALFSEMALRIFLIFYMKLGDYKGRKVTEPNFWKNLIWRYSQKGLQISPKSDTLIFFSKTALTIFLVFGLKLVLNMTFNLNETYFSEKFAIWRYLTSKSSKLGCFLTIRRSSQCILVSFWRVHKLQNLRHIPEH